jgi:hypothetical protein
LRARCVQICPSVLRCCTMPIKSAIAPSEAALSASQRPEFFRLPKGGERDPFFGLSRSFFYRGEQLGYWRLIRIRERGKMRGITLVSFDTVARFMRRQLEADHEAT